MDNKLINTDLVERYVLHQLNEEELALFRGRLMFDEELRKQVVETKMLMNSLKAIANDGVIASSPSAQAETAAVSTRHTIYRTVAVAFGVLLIGSMTYYWSTSDNNTQEQAPVEKVATPEQAVAPVAVDEVENSPSDNVEEASTKESVAPVIPTNDNASDDDNDAADNAEEQIFAEASPNKSSKKKIEVKDIMSGEEDDGMIAFAASTGKKTNTFDPQEYDTIDYLEDVIENSTTKSTSTLVNIAKGENYRQTRDQYGAIHMDLNGNIASNENAQYIFKIYSNKSSEYEDNLPKYQESLTVKRDKDQVWFDIDFKIELAPGLYYYTIEEVVNDEKDMIYTHRIIVSK